MELTLTPFRPGDLAEYAAWFADAETSRRVSNPDASWLAHVMGEGGAWAIRDGDGVLVAVIDTEPQGERCYVSVTVAPSRRGQGIGAEVVRRFHAGPGVHFAVLEGRIAPHNVASVGMVRKAGFVLISPAPDADGMLRFELRKERR
ncbi:MAG TPA: GNAT family N-acetyltransferase [Bauldia sp.]|nr:GNAT family N-acetyltransferase [Bauldia sp.]